MKMLLIFLLVVLPLLTVMATKDPRGMGQLAQAIIMLGAYLLELTARILTGLANLAAGKYF